MRLKGDGIEYTSVVGLLQDVGNCQLGGVGELAHRVRVFKKIRMSSLYTSVNRRGPSMGRGGVDSDERFGPAAPDRGSAQPVESKERTGRPKMLCIYRIKTEDMPCRPKAPTWNSY